MHLLEIFSRNSGRRRLIVSCHISREAKIIGQYISGIYVESLPHHLLNTFFIFLKGQEPGQQSAVEE
jgi:hypothetical protein